MAPKGDKREKGRRRDKQEIAIPVAADNTALALRSGPRQSRKVRGDGNRATQLRGLQDQFRDLSVAFEAAAMVAKFRRELTKLSRLASDQVLARHLKMIDLALALEVLPVDATAATNAGWRGVGGMLGREIVENAVTEASRAKAFRDHLVEVWLEHTGESHVAERTALAAVPTLVKKPESYRRKRERNAGGAAGRERSRVFRLEGPGKLFEELGIPD